MSRFWVVGGLYRDTRFNELAHGHQEERYGPFSRWEDAQREWQRVSWANVDVCNARYRIVEEAMAD
jgi:hypothetical protein